VLVQLEIVFQFAIECLFCGEPGKVVIALKELVLALLDRVSQPPGAPALFMDNISFAVGEKSLDPLPSLGSLIRADHGTQNNYKFVMMQWFPYCQKFCRKAK
jgi:hypothetical protein